MNGKTHPLHLPTPAYQWNTVPPRTVNPAEQRPWYENPTLCAKRDLKLMTPDHTMNINGHMVTRHSPKAQFQYTVDGEQCNFDDALAKVCEPTA